MKTLITLLLLALIPAFAFSFTGKGSGSKADPYQIATLLELQEVAKMHAYNLYFILMNDIDASETRNWNVCDNDLDSTTPDQPKGFIPIDIQNCNFDGNGFVVKNLFINLPNSSPVGLFGYVMFSTIQKIGIENCDITGGSFTGGLVGYAASDTINECFTTGNIKAIKGKDQISDIGGFVGIFLESSMIRNCYSNCIVTVDSTNCDNCITSFSLGVIRLDAIFCYTTGKVNGSNKEFNAFYPQDNGNLTCFWDIESTGIPDLNPNAFAHGLPTEEMRKQKTYTDWEWDFKNIWCIDEGKDYPKLRVFGGCPTDVKSNEPVLDLVSISPNPASDFIVISVGANGRSPLQSDIKIFNIYGQTVLSVGAIHELPLRIDVSGLAPGMYFVRIGDRVGKFIKL